MSAPTPKREITDQDKLAVVERLIEDFRWARSDPAVPEHATYCILKVLATDLRAAMPSTAEAVRRELGRRVADAARSQTPLGYNERHMVGIGQYVIANWPAIEHALEQQAGRRST